MIVKMIGHTDEERAKLLAEIGVSNFEELIQSIPESIRLPRISGFPSLTEQEVCSYLTELENLNRKASDSVCFLGAGAYDHYIPAVVDELCSRSEFVTAYTPYQAEASQGILQALFEFQTVVCELLGMEVANASLYDGASSLAEAVLLAARHTHRTKVLISSTVHPLWRAVVRTYLIGSGVELIEIPASEGVVDKNHIQELLTDSCAAVALQSPNFFGCLEDWTGVSSIVHNAGALFIAVANPLALGVLKSPGEWDADIAVCEGQPLGIPLSFGGPYLGILAAKHELLRQMPGRIVGMTKDVHGKRAFTLTLQTREQHIRRARATSNICTSQTLMALRALVYLCAVGKEGIHEVGTINIERSHTVRDKICAVDSWKAMFGQPFFNEFVVRCPGNPLRLVEYLSTHGIIGGLPLASYYSEPEYKDGVLFCATEKITAADIDKLISALKEYA